MANDISQPAANHAPSPSRPPWLALLLLVPAPTIGVLFAMHWFPDTWYGQTVHLAAKGWLLLFPLAWVVWAQRGRLTLPKWSWRGMTAGVVTGVLTLAVIIGAWELFAHRMVDVAMFREKMHEIGLGTPARFLGFAAAVTVINALLEEYVWRWFVYEKARDTLAIWFGGSVKAMAVPGAVPGAIPGAIVLAGLFFVLHHSVAMSVYFDWRVNALASLGIFMGSATWSILYIKYKNIYAGYISHVFADIALFYVGYRVAFG
ncbi:MAG: type II CAAX prenyl endopeptidase Rce1 family protein [Phycisphaeraceae bacterium]